MTHNLFELPPSSSWVNLQFKSHNHLRVLGGGLFIGDLNDIYGSLGNQTPYIHMYINKNKCICTNDMLKNGLMYLY